MFPTKKHKSHFILNHTIMHMLILALESKGLFLKENRIDYLKNIMAEQSSVFALGLIILKPIQSLTLLISLAIFPKVLPPETFEMNTSQDLTLL